MSAESKNNASGECAQAAEAQQSDTRQIAEATSSSARRPTRLVLAESTTSNGARGAVNDLVADLCLNGPSNVAERQSCSSGGSSSITNTNSTSFSLKNFLSNSSQLPAATSVASLDVVSSTTAECDQQQVQATVAQKAQNSTGARPKVPQQPDVQSSSSSSRMKRSPRFSSFDSQASLSEHVAGTSCSQQPSEFEPRSAADDDEFPTLLASLPLSTNPRFVPRSLSSYDVPPVAAAAATQRRRGGSASSDGNKSARPSRLTLPTAANSASKLKLDFSLGASSQVPSSSSSSSAAAAAGLPDFVQDHWLDSFYVQNQSLEARSNSPTQRRHRSPSNQLPLNMPSNRLAASEPASDASNKMLPDFLSDGPIIHSSQRLADVTVGLPTSSGGSSSQRSPRPDTPSTLLAENERLQRELSEARAQLAAQQRQAAELEQRLLARYTRQQEDTSAQLRQQICRLNTEVSSLRRENETLREYGAVGGSNSSKTGAKPSKKNARISHELRLAAASAESHLRQLLAGVDNLRQMAAAAESDSESNNESNE